MVVMINLWKTEIDTNLACIDKIQKIYWIKDILKAYKEPFIYKEAKFDIND